ncbi:alpha/beta hydrolase [Nitrospira sp. M1]
MIYRLLMAFVSVVCALLVTTAVTFAHGNTHWTPKKVLSLRGTVVEHRVNFPVTLTTGKRLTMAGFFYFKVKRVNPCLSYNSHRWVMACLIHANVGNKPLQTLIPGLTYNHHYWNGPRINRRNYSYAQFMARKGFVVLALDLLGSGKSDVPAGDLITLNESSFTIAQVLFRLKSKNNPLRRSFRKVIVVGHSLGAILSVHTLGTFPHAADALIVTAWAYAPHVVLMPDVVQAALESPYVRFPPALRTQAFYFLSKADPSMVNFDNRFLPDQTPRGIFTQGLPLLQAMVRGNADDVEFIKNFSRSNRIRVPVLIQLGEFDVLAPASLADQEASFYPRAPTVRVQTLTGIGHSFNLHVNRFKSWNGILGWLKGNGKGDDDD